MNMTLPYNSFGQQSTKTINYYSINTISVEDLIYIISFKETNMLLPEIILTEWRMDALCVTWATPILKLMW